MSQRHLTRQQVVDDADPLLNYAGRQIGDELACRLRKCRMLSQRSTQGGRSNSRKQASR
jgi:hypothetical protein